VNHADSSDEELMERFYARDEQAWEELERRHRNRLLRCARVRCGELAWDAVQETFLRVVRARDGGGSWVCGKGTVRCWLNRILANCITDMYRKEQRHGAPPLSLSPDEGESHLPVPSPAPGPDAEAFLAEIEQRWRAALSPEVRVMLRMVQQGMKQAEIAQVLGCSDDYVSKHLIRARRVLEELLGCRNQAEERLPVRAP
jgi:RNA polymerase sigma factor (sigma-70 family)